LDINDNAPVFVAIPTSAAENQTAIGCFVVTDSDLFNPAPTPAPNCGIASGLTLSISGDNLQVNSVGYLSFISAPDYETKSSYTATVTASDGVNTTTQDITVNVTDVTKTFGECVLGQCVIN
ncbi:cadherin repeat domain-containing protein, partial [Gammaproteobacteria bacterium]|nr:cadherin repeat domain-containing protein [Gammaproteobacteria bacterium]